MTDRTRWVVLLIAGSLLSVVGLQAYYAWQVYQQQTATLQRETSAALTEAVATADQERVERINRYFAQDVRDPERIELTFEVQEGKPRIFVIDPATDLRHVSFPYLNWTDSTRVTPAKLEQQLIERNRRYLAEEGIMYWTPAIGKRLVAYVDSLRISVPYLRQQMQAELQARGISSAFEFHFRADGDSLDSAPGHLRSQAVTGKFPQHQSVTATLPHPDYEVLRRTGGVLLLTVGVLLLIGLSFAVLIRILNRQKKLSQLKDDFIDNVTHELLTPIATLKLALETLAKDPSLPQGHPYLSLSAQQTQRIAEVVEHILRVSFVDQSRPGLSLEPVEVEPLLQGVLRYHRATAQKPVGVQVEGHSCPPVWADRRHLSNVLHNVIGNAIKYAPEEGVELRVELESEGERVVVRVSDNGPGIPAAEQERIFEKFHRINARGTHDVKGLGLGLYYARGILRQMRGDLQLVHISRPGSTFALTLPSARSPLR